MGRKTAGVLAGAIIGLSLVLSGCDRPDSPVALSPSGLPMDQTLGLEQSKDQVVVPLGGQITVVLRGKPDTGYRWRMPVVAPADAFVVVDQQDGEDKTLPFNPLVGGEHSSFQVTLKAQELGPATIRFRNEGPSGDGEPAVFKLVVRR